MRKIGKVVLRVLAGVVALIAVVIGADFGYRAYAQHQLADALAITTPNGIVESGYVTIGGTEQWIQIRGQDRNNPVLLFVHGGAGAAAIIFSPLFAPLEKEFTVVFWDERGAGRSLAKSGPEIAATMNIDRMTRDGIEVVEYLRRNLHKEKVVVMGHSWGTVLAIHMIKERPDLFSAYVGTGQFTTASGNGREKSQYVLAKAKAAQDTQAEQELQSAFASSRPELIFQTVNKWADKYDQENPALPSQLLFGPPDYTLADYYYLIKGLSLSRTVLWPELSKVDLPAYARRFAVPVFIFQGDDDHMTPTTLAREYVDAMEAPHKEWVSFPGNHFAVFTLADQFHKELVARVLPYALR